MLNLVMVNACSGWSMRPRESVPRIGVAAAQGLPGSHGPSKTTVVGGNGERTVNRTTAGRAHRPRASEDDASRARGGGSGLLRRAGPPGAAWAGRYGRVIGGRRGRAIAGRC